MTLFDLVAVGIILVSALVGFTRGGVRELVTVLAFTVAAMAAVFLLPFSGPLFRDVVKPAWAANAAAVVVVFIVAYIAYRLAGHWVTSKLRAQPALSTVDRVIGLAFGVVRALVFLGVFYLVFNMATPPELVPQWLSRAKLYPVARVSAEALQGVLPKRLLGRDRLGPALGQVVEDDPAPEGAAANASRRNPPRDVKGYDKRTRDDIDALIERSR